MIVASLTFATVRGLDFNVCSPTKQAGLFPSESTYKWLDMVCAVALQIKTHPHPYELRLPSLFLFLSPTQLTPVNNYLLPFASSANQSCFANISTNQMDGLFFLCSFFFLNCSINKCDVTENRCLAMRLEHAGRKMVSVPPQLIKDQFLGELL